jgi:hypothetical protein
MAVKGSGYCIAKAEYPKNEGEVIYKSKEEK